MSNHIIMPSCVESLLTRELDLRFIDARALATEARISLGVEGYPSRDQVADLRREAIRIFQTKSIDEQRALQKLNMDFEAIKFPAGSVASASSSVDGSADSCEESSETGCSRHGANRRNGIRSFFRR